MNRTTKDFITLFAVAVILFLVAGCGETNPSAIVGVRGEPGPQGPQGAQGTPGIPGINGTDGTVVTPVQLCPNVAPTYASVFPEYGLCINGVLYGTWNQNTNYQYFAAIPDGSYSSNGQGAACSFNLTGCTITY